MSVTFSGLKSNSAILVPQGGTGVSSLPVGGVLIGQGTDAVNVVVGSEGEVLTFISGTWVGAQPTNNGGGSGGLSTVNTSGNLQGDGSSGSPVTMKASISLTDVTASFSGNGSAITNLTASQIGGLDGAIDARITNIPNASLQNSSITINGQAVSLGGSATISADGGISAVSSSGNLQGDGTSGSELTLKDNISLTSVTASFSGSGAKLTNLSASQLSNFSSDVRKQISVDGGSLVYDSSTGIISLAPTQSSTLSAQGQDYSVLYLTGSGFAVGNVVALSGSVVKADYSDNLKSNAIGIVYAADGNDISVKILGEVTVTSASLVSGIGTPVYVGPNGSVVQYSSIPSGKYITQVGYISPTSGKVILQLKTFGQMA